MRCFLYASLLLLVSCGKQAYKDRETATTSREFTATALKPHFEKQLYRCVVDGRFAFKKYHLSGILFLKSFPDSTTRVLFQGEMGNTFFDFSWDKNDSFQVSRIIEQMNKPALIKTLKKDFELLLVKQIPQQSSGTYHYNNNRQETYLRFELPKGFVQYVINERDQLVRIENADDRKKVVIMELKPPASLKQLPEELKIRHLRAHFTIDLKKIPTDDIAE